MCHVVPTKKTKFNKESLPQLLIIIIKISNRIDHIVNLEFQILSDLEIEAPEHSSVEQLVLRFTKKLRKLIKNRITNQHSFLTNYNTTLIQPSNE